MRNQRKDVRKAIASGVMIAVASLAAQSATAAIEYRVTELPAYDPNLGVIPYAINNLGQVVGATANTTLPSALLWSNGGVQYLGDLPGGVVASEAKSINDAGLIVGWSSGGTNGVHSAVFWQNGSLTEIGGLPLGTSSGQPRTSQANAVNNLGQVVGIASIGVNGQNKGFFWQAGQPSSTIQPIGILGAVNSINDSAVAVGTSSGATQTPNDAFVWRGADIAVLPDIQGGSGTTAANAINNSGQIVGFATLGSGQRTAVAWGSGGLVDLGTLQAGRNAEALDNNNLGTIVGGSRIGVTPSAFIYTASRGMVDLNSLIDPLQDWTLWSATAINDSGVIVGIGMTGLSNRQRGFILTPVPEPSTYAMMIAGLGLLGFMSRRRLR